MNQKNIIQEKIIKILRLELFIDSRDQQFAVRQIRDLITEISSRRCEMEIIKYLIIYNDETNTVDGEKDILSAAKEKLANDSPLHLLDKKPPLPYVKVTIDIIEIEPHYLAKRPEREVIHA